MDALSLIVHRDKAYYMGREVAEKLRSVIPRQMYEVIIQAATGSKIIARDKASGRRHAKCYGGDITRKEASPAEGREEKDETGGRIEVPSGSVPVGFKG